ncbi:MAG: PAS domain S-box protein [Rhodocyclaceae bacterium]
MLRNSSLKVRVWLIVILSIIPLILFSVLDFQAQKGKAALAMEQSVHAYLHAAKAEEAAARRHVQQVFRIMAASDDLRDLEPVSCNGLSARLLGTHNDFSNIGAAGLDGRLFCSALPLKAAVDVRDREWFKEVLARSEMTGGEFLVGRVSGVPGVAFGYPMLGATGKLSAVLFIASKISWFDRMAENVQLPAGWELTLLTKEGAVVSHYPDSKQKHGLGFDIERISYLSPFGDDGDRIGEVMTAGGVHRMVGVTPITSTHGALQVLISAPIGVSYAAVEQGIYRQLAVLALVALFSIVLARVLLLRLVNVWAQHLAEGARRIAQGHFGERLPLADGGVELNSVVAGFNAMADALVQREALQRAAEEKLRASQEQLDLVLRGSNDGWWDFDMAAQRFFYSPRWYSMLGYLPGEVGDGEALWLEMLHPEDRLRARQNFEASLQGQSEVYEVEFRMRHKAGHYVPILSRGYILRDADGNAIRVSGSNMDLSEIKAKDDELRKLSLAVEQSPASIVITDVEARIIYANPAFTRVSGYAGAEAAGQNPRILQSGRTPKTTYDDMWATLTRGAVWRGELINKRKDGTEYIEKATISPVSQEDGRITHYLAIKEDITEQKRIARELEAYRTHLEEVVTQRTYELAEARDVAEQASRAKSTFLANMSHEIRTPMNAITGFVHLLAKSLLDESQREKLAKIDHASRHLLRIINDVLDLSKIESGKLVLESRRFSPAEVLATVGTMIRDAAQLHGVEVTIVADTLPTRVLGDETRLRQALLNFAANAVKFTPQGKILITGEVVSRDAGVCQLKFSVIDTGIGIAADALPRLFQPFEQADTSITRQHGGTGLGLAISRYLAELMGGEVGVESQLGKGSTFWLTGCFAEVDELDELSADAGIAQAAVASVADYLRRQHASAAILLVEDDEVNSEVALELLAGVGLSADTAGDGALALAAAAARHYDLILMDVQMPVMDGLQATAAFRALEAYRQTPILALTANAFDEDQTRCLAAGMNDFISKPINPDVLYEKVLYWLSRGGAETSLDSPARTGEVGVENLPPPLSAQERDQLYIDLATLDAFLQSGNQEASLLFRRLFPRLRDLAPDSVRPLQQAVEHYDYTLASVYLAALVDKLGLHR